MLKAFANVKNSPVNFSVISCRKGVDKFLVFSNIFSDFISQQCQLIPKDGILLLIPAYYTDNRLFKL